MDLKGTLRGGRCQSIAALAAAAALGLALLTVEPSASAAPRSDGRDDGAALYNGAFWGLQVETGLLWRVEARQGEGPGPLIALSGRLATLMSLLDVKLTVLAGGYDIDTDISVSHYSAGIALHAHPLFMKHLGNDALHYWLGALYLSVGAAFDQIEVSTPSGGESLAAFGWQLGAGTDIPLGDVERGWGLWLGLAYRVEFLTARAAGVGGFDEHALFITLGYRNNEIDFARIPRPPELDDREPLPSTARVADDVE